MELIHDSVFLKGGAEDREEDGCRDSGLNFMRRPITSCDKSVKNRMVNIINDQDFMEILRL